MTKKLYPFSMNKYGHNIELAYNRQWRICEEMLRGERKYDEKAFEWKDELTEAYLKMMSCSDNGLISWVDGHTYGILREANVWAETYRDSKRR